MLRHTCRRSNISENAWFITDNPAQEPIAPASEAHPYPKTD